MSEANLEKLLSAIAPRSSLRTKHGRRRTDTTYRDHMKKLLIPLLALLLAFASYYYFLSPQAVLKRKAQTALDAFSAAVQSKDRTKVDDALKTLLADSAHIRLEVNFFPMALKSPAPMAEDFDKASFITF